MLLVLAEQRMTVSLAWQIIHCRDGWRRRSSSPFATRTRRAAGNVEGSRIDADAVADDHRLDHCLQWIAGARGPNLPGSAHDWKFAGWCCVIAGWPDPARRRDFQPGQILQRQRRHSAHPDYLSRRTLPPRPPSFLLRIADCLSCHRSCTLAELARLLQSSAAATTAALLYRIQVEEAALQARPSVR